RMADGELSRPLSSCLHADPRHAGWARLRLAVGYADEGHRADGLDDRPPLRDRLREAWTEQAPLEIDHGSLREAEGKRAAVEFVLGNRHCERSEAIHCVTSGIVDCFVASLLAMTNEEPV